MADFYEAMVICAFDVEKASEMTHTGSRTLREVVDDILTEAGLENAVASVQPQS